MRRDIVREVTYPHPVERVWQALTDPGALEVWLMPNDFEPEVGHRFQFRTDPAPGFDGIIDCTVLRLEPLRLLEISWDGGPVDAVVTWRLEPVAEGTRLHFAMRGFTGPKAVAVSFILGMGFKSMYHRALPAVLERLAEGANPRPQSEDHRAAGSNDRANRGFTKFFRRRR